MRNIIANEEVEHLFPYSFVLCILQAQPPSAVIFGCNNVVERKEIRWNSLNSLLRFPRDKDYSLIENECLNLLGEDELCCFFRLLLTYKNILYLLCDASYRGPVTLPSLQLKCYLLNAVTESSYLFLHIWTSGEIWQGKRSRD